MLAFGLGSLSLCASARAIVLPAGFADQSVADVPQATAFAFVPGGRILITSQLGQLYVYDDGALRSTPALDLQASDRVCNNMERGLLGVAVDPAFADQHYVYLYYTFKKNGACETDPANAATLPVNRVSRFHLGSDDTIDPASEQVLIDNINTPSGVHNAGDLQFGADGYLYASVGDGGCNYLNAPACGPFNSAARDHNVLLGKILRITSDGDIPSDNPFVGPGSARCNATGVTAPGTWCQETFAWGLRNPFRFTFDAMGSRMYINDVGQEDWEEIDSGQPGADYGWNTREGHCAPQSQLDCGPPPAGMTNPIYDYNHSAGCSSVTGGAFVPAGVWPSAYDGHYLFADIVCNKVFDLAPDGVGGFTAGEFATDVVSPVEMHFSPGSSPALYYLSYWPGNLHRIAFTGVANRSPHAVATAGPENGPLPLEVDLDAVGSNDPDGDPLTYDWGFGDGSPHETSPQAHHVYASAGIYSAKLTVTDFHGAQDTASVVIHAGDNEPTPVIQSPARNAQFGSGETITLSGTATDPEEGQLPASALKWQVIKHHATHTHPFLGSTPGNDVTISGPVPEDANAITNTYLEIRLTATDSQGLSTTVIQNMYPALVNIGFATEPPNLRLLVNGATAPPTFIAWRGWRLTLSAPDQTDAEGQAETFVSWSDGGTQTHVVTTPAIDTSYSATFTRYYARPKGATPLRASLVPAYKPCVSPNNTHGSPLAFGSCSPPTQTSQYATVGTPDANGLTARSLGSVRMIVIPGNPATTENEADVALKAQINDVLAPVTLNDYVGELQASVDLRITDRQNGATGTDTATVSDFPLLVKIPCTATPDPSGSTCAVMTTADAITPGSVVEGQREVWQLDRVQVYDGGPDGLASTADNTPFATQGVFVP
jgi:glucose/arabinose dehydrogenase/PKD repeat protein